MTPDSLRHSVHLILHNPTGKHPVTAWLNRFLVLLYIFEHEAQPKMFSSIPATLWWSIITLATIGYGDMVPVTIAGKVCAGFTAIFGVGVFALPTAILTAAVIEAGNRADVCPHCGKARH